MDYEDLIEFYHYRLYKKLIVMEYMERAAFMTDLFGRRWTEVYGVLTILYPSLTDVKQNT
jgi:hypothetical protein